MSRIISFTYTSEFEPTLRELLVERGFQFADAEHSHWRAKVPGCSVTFYRSGKLIIQGRDAETWAEIVAPHQMGARSGEKRFASALQKLPDGQVEAWIGSDESGKGDYFGPLVVCAARVERSQLDLLVELGVDDCKSLSDKKIWEMTPGLKALCPHRLVVINPERYNTLHRDMGSNLNRLMAWAHARAIEGLLEAHPQTSLAVIDRFGPENRITQALMERGQKIQVIQRHRAEDDPAVAVASVLARHAFISHIGRLSKSRSMQFPKGAGPPVIAAARQFVKRFGEAELSQVAKVHFKTTQTALGISVRKTDE